MHGLMLVREFIETVINDRDLDAAAMLLAPDYVDRGFLYWVVPDRVSLHDLTSQLFAAFPDLRLTVEELLADEDNVVARWTARGRHLGPFAGYPPTGAWVEYAGVSIFRLAGGRIAESWTITETLRLLRQIGGSLPPVAAASSAASS